MLLFKHNLTDGRGCNQDFLSKLEEFVEACQAVHSKAPPPFLDEWARAGPKTFIDQCELLCSVPDLSRRLRSATAGLAHASAMGATGVPGGFGERLVWSERASVVAVERWEARFQRIGLVVGGNDMSLKPCCGRTQAVTTSMSSDTASGMLSLFLLVS